MLKLFKAFVLPINRASIEDKVLHDIEIHSVSKYFIKLTERKLLVGWEIFVSTSKSHIIS